MKETTGMFKLASFPAIAAVAAAALAMPAAYATDTAANGTPKIVHGVKLSSVCDACGVVTDVHTETRKGKATGVGVVGGAVVGGLIGNQMGGGSGKTATTAIGAVGGGIAGNEIEKNVKKHTVWVTSVTFKDGSKHKYERASDPGLKAGEVVKLENGHPVKRAS
jgi:outer membrane lipoprotein SlyB